MHAELIDWPQALPRAWGGPAAAGVLRASPEDFQVVEIPSELPSGGGDYVWLKVRKRNANTEWVARQLAQFAGLAPEAVSYAGLKDRLAITEQWFSVCLPGEGPDWMQLNESSAIEGVELMACARHARKLRRGALQGNHFRIRIRELAGDRAALEHGLHCVAEGGAPNYFGEQRFGREGGNLRAAAEMFARPRRDLSRHLRGLYLSAARSRLFNRVLAARVRAANWNRVLPGDVAQLPETGGQLEISQLSEAMIQRVAELSLHPTAPLWGRGGNRSRGEAARIEAEALAGCEHWCAGLDKAGLEMDRRSLRVRVEGLDWQFDEDTLELRFSLPAGAYATAVLRELVEYR